MEHDSPHQLCTQPFGVQDAEEWSRITTGLLLCSSGGQAETAGVFSMATPCWSLL